MKTVLTVSDLQEEWRPIPDWDGYEASSLGRIRSWKYGKPRLRMPVIRKDGRPRVKLVDRNRSKERQVGAWVLTTFVGPRPDGAECSHLNGDHSDNRPENLAWETHAENVARKLGHGTAQRGSKHGMAKLVERDVQIIRRMLGAGLTQTLIAATFDVDKTNISAIHNGRTWRHVS